MAFEAKPQTGALFQNKVKKHPQAPDYQGDILIDTRQMEIKDGLMHIKLGGWKKTSTKGMVFLSLAVDTYKPKTQESQPHPKEDFPDHDIPF